MHNIAITRVIKHNWKEHKPEHQRLFKLLPSTGEKKEEEPTEIKKKTTDENKSKIKFNSFNKLFNYNIITVFTTHTIPKFVL